MNKKLYTFICGDRYHGQIVYNNNAYCNMDPQDAYEKGTEKLGFDLVDDYCYYHGSDKLPYSIIEKIDSSYAQDIIPYLSKDKKLVLEVKDWFELYFKICKIGEPDFEYELLETKGGVVYIGGYGLF